MKSQEPKSEQLNSAVKFFSEVQFQKTLSLPSQVLDIFSNSVALFNIIGVTNSKLEQFEAAITNFNLALKIRPGLVDGYKNMGNALHMPMYMH